MRMFKDRELYRQLVRIALPIAMQNLIIFAVSMADTVMIGMLGNAQLAAVTLANQVTFVFNLFTFGLGSGCNVLIAQYWGKGDTESIRKVMTIMYRVLLGGAVLFAAGATFFPNSLMRIFSNDPLVIAEGARFLRVVGVSYLVSGFSTTTMFVLRSVGSVNISLVVYISSLVVNISLNWVLIFGRLGAPALGMEGAAIATCIARLTEIVIVAIYCSRFEKRLNYRIRDFFAKKIGLVRDFVKNAVPVIINELLWGGGSATIMMIFGRMGTDTTVAYSVCNVLGQLVTIFIFGSGNAAAVIVGNTVGSGRYELARQRARSFGLVSLVLGVVSSGVVLLMRRPMIAIYDVQGAARDYTWQIMTAYAVVVVFQSLCAIAMVGVLRGGGGRPLRDADRPGVHVAALHPARIPGGAHLRLADGGGLHHHQERRGVQGRRVPDPHRGGQVGQRRHKKIRRELAFLSKSVQILLTSNDRSVKMSYVV